MILSHGNYTKETLIKIKKIIKDGGIIAIPTDTVYGLAADALNKKSIAKIYELKRREFTNPMNVLVSNMEMVKSIAKDISKVEEKIMQSFFPGALTIILKKNKMIPKIVTSNLDTIGVRMPDNKFLLKLMDFIRNTHCCNKLQLGR